MYVRALHSRSDRAVFKQAAALCAGREPLARAVGADVLAQLGTHAGIQEYPFADESAPVLVSLLRDTDNRVIASALYALGHLKGESRPNSLALRSTRRRMFVVRSLTVWGSIG